MRHKSNEEKQNLVKHYISLNELTDYQIAKLLGVSQGFVASVRQNSK